MRHKWDTEMGRCLYLDGQSDEAIAEHFGIAKSTVATYRRKHWEKGTTNAEARKEPGGTQQNPEPVSAEEKAVSMSSPDGVYRILEEATKTRTGIEAICTADAMLCLWNWNNADDLRRARSAISYLIKRLEG